MSSALPTNLAIHYDFDNRVAVLQTNDEGTKHIVFDLLRYRQFATLDKIILICNNEFFYIKNRCGSTGEFIPNQEEQDLIFGALLQEGASGNKT